MDEPERKSRPLSDLVPHALNPMTPLRVMGRLVRPAQKKAGAAPGTIVHTGRRKLEEVHIHAMRYDVSGLEEETWTDITSRPEIPEPGKGVLWVNVEGLHEVDLLERTGRLMGFHPLAIEDVAHIGQRPKIEEYEDHLFVVAHMLQLAEDDPSPEDERRIEDEQLSMIIGPGFLFTFQESPGDVFEAVRQRLRDGKGKIRSRGSDYLAYALLDALVDSYFGILEALGERAETLEAEVIDDPSEETVRGVHELKRELLVLRRSIWPLREMMSSFLRVEGDLVEENTKLYLRDVHDHSYQLIDTVEILRDITTGTRDLYLSNVSNRTNEVMKVLTIMASVFIPLTFVAGVYGMNFQYMPELGWRWAYPSVWGVMIAVTLGMMWFFRRKGWI